MKSFALLTLAALSTLALSSCQCDCNRPNSDYLRDVPTSRSQYFH